MISLQQQNWKKISHFALTVAAVCCPTLTTPAAQDTVANKPHTTTLTFQQPLTTAIPEIDTVAHDKPRFPFPNLKSAYTYCDKNKYASIVYDPDTGETIFAHNEDKMLVPASIVKLMSAFIVFKEIALGHLSLDEIVAIEPKKYPYKKWQEKDVIVLGPKETDKVDVEKLVRAMLTMSAADAPEILAHRISGSPEAFVDEMNYWAGVLDMTNTKYTNASGAPDPQQFSSVGDTKKLVMAIRQCFPHLLHYMQDEPFMFHGREIKGHAVVPGANIGKTGFTFASGYNTFLSFAEQEQNLDVIIFGGMTAPGRNKHAIERKSTARKLIKSDTTRLRPAPAAPKIADLLTLQLFDQIRHNKESIAVELIKSREPIHVPNNPLMPSIGL